MLSARHRQAADADTRKSGGRRVAVAKSPEQAMPETAGLEASVWEQTSGGPMYGWQAAIVTGGKGAKSVQKGGENSKLDARKRGQMRINARKCGFGEKMRQNYLK